MDWCSERQGRVARAKPASFALMVVAQPVLSAAERWTAADAVAHLARAARLAARDAVAPGAVGRGWRRRRWRRDRGRRGAARLAGRGAAAFRVRAARRVETGRGCALGAGCAAGGTGCGCVPGAGCAAGGTGVAARLARARAAGGTGCGCVPGAGLCGGRRRDAVALPWRRLCAGCGRTRGFGAPGGWGFGGSRRCGRAGCPGLAVVLRGRRLKAAPARRSMRRSLELARDGRCRCQNGRNGSSKNGRGRRDERCRARGDMDLRIRLRSTLRGNVCSIQGANENTEPRARNICVRRNAAVDERIFIESAACAPARGRCPRPRRSRAASWHRTRCPRAAGR